ncbi:GntR family transcriptional regulator [Actinacidiphila epipremni]|jgi:DNA-binding GntR family transcriptional regulator|uniref:GntR family transcriptional regulator n=1 Tax=Actinacidiphila epipremni TaxID=2053013 RepID=A0ABX0ZV87_9ACTN|nr:GntR family transcriptional regulator [Actinacidiphila epipremni]NJP47943.1 GntR family transcriptional regulator [Actinacidiphila epipremni]
MTSPSEAASSSVDLVDRVRLAIAHGELLPGQHLVETDLAAMFSASRGAVRSALTVLDADGLVTRTPNRGARVRPISLAEAVEITELRAVIEGLCAAKAAQRATAQERADLRRTDDLMRAAVEAGDSAAYSRLSETVHETIRRIAAQATAVDVLDRLRYRSVRYQFSVARLPGRPQQGAEEHSAVVRAVVAGKADDAEREMRAHLQSVIGALYDLQAQGGLYAIPAASRPATMSPAPGA